MSELGWLGLFFIGLGFLAWFLERPPRRLFPARPMARRGVSEKRQKAAAVQGALRQMAQGERPLYRVRMIQGGGWTVVGAEWLSGTAATPARLGQLRGRRWPRCSTWTPIGSTWRRPRSEWVGSIGSTSLEVDPPGGRSGRPNAPGTRTRLSCSETGRRSPSGTPTSPARQMRTRT